MIIWAHFRLRIGKGVRSNGHRGAGASDFGGHVRLGGVPRGLPGGAGGFEQEGGIVFVNERGRFEAASLLNRIFAVFFA
jgi:hypothetical protein